MGLSEQILGLAEIVKVSSEFSRLKQSRSIISKNPALTNEIEELFSSQRQLLAGSLSAKESELSLKQLNTQYEKLSKVPEVGNYIKALNDFNQMMSKIFNKMNEYLEKELK